MAVDALGVVTNEAQVSAPGDSDPANNRASVDTTVEAALGVLRVTTTPAVPRQIIVDGDIANTWGSDWMKISAGSHEVCFTDVEGWLTPPCETVDVDVDLTTEVDGAFAQNGSLRAVTSPAVPSTITIDGVPSDDFEVWTDFPPGDYEVCFGDVADHTVVGDACQTATVIAGALVTITGTFSVTAGTPGPSSPFGFLRVTTDTGLGGGVPSQISVDGVAVDSWALTWAKMPPGSHTVCFSDVQEYTTPACEGVTIIAGATSTVNGLFTERAVLRVVTAAPHPSTIYVDDIPRNDWGLWTDILVGAHTVCFGEAAGFTPPCEAVVLVIGANPTVTGTWPS